MLYEVITAGFTDDVGSYEYNLGLSQRRAATVSNMLAVNGRPYTKGCSYDKAIAPNDSATNSRITSYNVCYTKLLRPIENQTQAEHKMLKAKAVVDQTQLNNILEKDHRKTVSVAIKTEGKEKMLPL